jgi:ParB-like chromosome segregation protein Spo0J
MSKSPSPLTTEMVKVSDIKPNEVNPRVIRDAKFQKLVKSIKEFPEMLNLRPIVVDTDMVVLGGNMRLKAAIEAGFSEVPVIKASSLNEEQKREFIIKDNVAFGEWDWDILSNDWDTKEINDWGLSFPSGPRSKLTEACATRAGSLRPALHGTIGPATTATGI